MMKQYSIGLILIIINLYQVFGQDISDDKIIDGEYGKDLIIDWTFSGENAFKILARIVSLTNTNSANTLFEGLQSTTPLEFAKTTFNNRLSVSEHNTTLGFLKLKLSDVQFEDAKKTFILQVVYSIDSGTIVKASKIEIGKVVDPKDSPKGGSSSGSDGGMIAGVVIGVLLFIIIVVVCIIFYKRYQRKKGGSTSRVDGSDTKLNYGDQDQYAETHVAMDQYNNEKQRHIAKEYAELGPGGGHDGPKPKHVPTHYHEVKRTDDGENARPTRDAPPPPKPDRGNVRTDSDGNLFSETVEV